MSHGTGRGIRSGYAKSTLSTEANTRAERFYRSAGWQFTGIDTNGDACFEVTLR